MSNDTSSPLSVVSPSRSVVREGPIGADSSTSVMWLGHATALAQLGVTRLLFDPLGRRRTRRAGPVDAVLITHSHVDHLNRWSLKVVPRSAQLVVPRGAASIVSDLGFSRVTEVSAGDQLQIGATEITAVPTCHDTGRWRKSALPKCVGYVVRHAVAGAPAIHHAGDVDFSDHSIFDTIGKHFALAATLLPVGGMMPVWYYRMRRRALDRGVHIDPDCALDIFERLGAKTMVPVHWGTLNLRLGPPSMPKRRFFAQARDRQLLDIVSILGHGDCLTIKNGI